MCITRKLNVFFILKINMFPYMEVWKLRGKTYEKLCDILRSGTKICRSQKFPEKSLRLCCFLKFPEELDKFPEISLIFHGKAISLSFPESVGTLNIWKNKSEDVYGCQFTGNVFLKQGLKNYWERRRDDFLMWPTIRDNTWNVFNMQHITLSSKRWDSNPIQPSPMIMWWP